MASTIFHERRKQRSSATSSDRRNGDRRKKETVVTSNKRRLATQVRQHRRENLSIPVRLNINGNGIPGHTQNISPQGISVISPTALSVGTPMTLKFSFGENFCYMNLAGQVAFCLRFKLEGSFQYMVGVKFSAIRDFEQKILASAIQELSNNPTTQTTSLLTIDALEDKLALEAASLSTSKTGRPSTTRESHVYASKIIGWGSYLPPQEVTSQDITDRLGLHGYKNVGQVIESLTGIKARRYASAELYPSDLAAAAAKNALDNAKMDPKDVGVIIFCGIIRDFDEPATANVVQEKIGAKHAQVFDLANACNGFVNGIDALDAMIATGRCENGIVVTGEPISSAIDWTPKSKEDFKLSMFGYTLGDAGGAAVMTRRQANEERGMMASWFSSTGEHWRFAIGGPHPDGTDRKKFFKSNGLAMEKAALRYVPVGIENVMKTLNWDLQDIDLLIPHQVPASIIKNLFYKKLGMQPEKIYWTFPRYGNVGSASIPVAMDDAYKNGRVKPGNKVLLVGGAAGFSVGIIALVA